MKTEQEVFNSLTDQEKFNLIIDKLGEYELAKHKDIFFTEDNSRHFSENFPCDKQKAWNAYLAALGNLYGDEAIPAVCTQELKENKFQFRPLKHIEPSSLVNKIQDLFDHSDWILEWTGYDKITTKTIDLDTAAIFDELKKKTGCDDYTGRFETWCGLRIEASKRTRVPGRVATAISSLPDADMMFLASILIGTSAALFANSAIILGLMAAVTAMITLCVVANRFGFFGDNIGKVHSVIYPQYSIRA